MRILVTGIGDAFTRRYYSTSAVIEAPEGHVMIDCPDLPHRTLHDATRDCFVVWDRDRSEFVGNDVCPDLVYSEDGRGLRQYPVEIIDGQVVATIAG